jgi:ribonuclease G
LLNWFRRKKRPDEPAPREGATPEPPEPVATAPARVAGTDPTRKRRRRGSRGGRGRKKPGTPTQSEAAEKPAQPERKPVQQRTRKTQRRRTPAKRPPLPKAKRELLVSAEVSEQRVAVLEDDRVAEVYLERPERRSITGNIYKGVVDNVLPGMEAAFVEIGLEKNGFLFVDEIVGPELEGKRHGKKIQDLIQRGEEVLVQAVKDPMKSKGARLTTEISLPGRFVVFVPSGEGLGVSRRLDDDERNRLREIIKGLKVDQGGVIVRTAAEGASADDIERDLVFLQRLWKAIQDKAKTARAPALAYQEAELPLRVVRDLFTDDFERLLVDDEKTQKRIVGYLKKTSPHMVERVSRYRDKTPLMEAHGVDAEVRSTLSRRVDLPSGGYLVFDYAEAFTVIDVNTGRFVGSRSKSSGGRLEDTITKNNLEAVKEVVRQLRLRDVGGIIVIDFIDMANPKNRATVEEALKSELERDRTKTYVVEISPLGLVEMTRQNVTDGPREILTQRCPVCTGDGVVLSETSLAVDLERRLRALAAGSRHKAYKVAVNAHVGSRLIGPGAQRLAAIEAQTKRRFLLELEDDVPTDHFEVLGQGTLESVAPKKPPVQEGAEVKVKLVEVGLHDVSAGVGALDGYSVCVGGAAKLVGKSVKVRIERVLDGTAYATLVEAKAAAEDPITAESQAEKPTRQPGGRKKAEPATKSEPKEEAKAEKEEAATDAPPRKKRTRRGSRGGRGRKKKTTAATDANGSTPSEEAPKIHLPDPELGSVEARADGAAEPSEDGAEAPKPKKKTRRGSRGGRNRRRKPAAASAEKTAEN